ncbi:MAG: SDR family NAD(P)-dependent oxidoreductase, partial [Actinomycetota bacterium]|nr:SDR family NAD(P)-dependent oxidoreductase [Actinomycetota bacterium]
MGRFDGRVAIITGAARGIGAGTARRFAEEGAAVAVLDLDEDQARTTAEGLGAGRAIGVASNVSDAASVDAAVGRVIEELGGLHILVNNAGITRDNLLFKLTEEDWDAVLGVHLKGAFLMSKAAQKTFVEQQYGKILNLSSTSANGNRGQANYSAAKAGVQGFTRT